MNYYERHLGDYAKDTLHLSMLEHGAYTLLMDRYYSTEHGIPAEQVYRVALARSKDEKAAVDTILAEFFTINDGVFIKGRIEEEIEKYLSGEPEREVKKANEKNRLSKHREERATLFKCLTDAGQHAQWNIGMPELRVLVQRLGNEPATAHQLPATAPATAPATPATATQTPDPDSNIKPINQSTTARDPKKFQMHIGWQPSGHVAGLAKQSGAPLVDSDLPEFVAHWLTQPITHRTQAEWDKALLQSAKHRELRAKSPLLAKEKPARTPEDFSKKDYGTEIRPL